MEQISWTAPEYAHRPKKASWYWISIIVAILILGLAVWQKNYLFSFFVLVSEILLIVWGDRPPRMVDFQITEKGLRVDNKKFYPWSELKAFSVEVEDFEHLEWIDIAIFSGHIVRPSTIIRASKEIVPEISDKLRSKIKEMPWEPSFLDTIERLMHF